MVVAYATGADTYPQIAEYFGVHMAGGANLSCEGPCDNPRADPGSSTPEADANWHNP